MNDLNPARRFNAAEGCAGEVLSLGIPELYPIVFNKGAHDKVAMQKNALHNVPVKATVHEQFSGVDGLSLPLFKMSNFGVWKGPELGRGYSGVVHHGVGVLWNEDESDIREAKPMALKVSKPKQIHLGHSTFGSPGREFETLRHLYSNKVPVPRPLGFCLNLDDQGNGRTLLVMDIVQGCTLREWINSKTESVYRHNPSGRTIHPAGSIDAALERIDVAVTLIEALQKLHQFGVFVDLKPRNIMIGQCKVVLPYYGEWCEAATNSRGASTVPGTRCTYPVTLVDIGGVVLRSDIEEDSCEDAESMMKNSTYLPHQTHHGPSSFPPHSAFDCNLQNCCKTSDLSLQSAQIVNDRRNSRAEDYGFKTSFSINGAQLFRTTPEIPRWHDLAFLPTRHRHLVSLTPDSNFSANPLPNAPVFSGVQLETTCSYISPELAAIVTESDRGKLCLPNHFQSCIGERFSFYSAEVAAKRLWRGLPVKPSNKTSDSYVMPGTDAFELTECEIKKPEGMNLSVGSSSTLPWHVEALYRCHAGEFDRNKKQSARTSGEAYQSCIDGSSEFSARETVKLQILEKSYAESLRLLFKEHVLTRRRSEPLENAIVHIGQKSSVFSLGLILVELFGGLRTGLSALCSVPIISQWFSKDFAYEAYFLQYEKERQVRRNSDAFGVHDENCPPSSLMTAGGRTALSTTDMMLTSGSRTDIPRSPRSVSVSTFSGKSHRRADSEFRMTLEWEYPKIPYQISVLDDGAGAPVIDVAYLKRKNDVFTAPEDQAIPSPNRLTDIGTVPAGKSTNPRAPYMASFKELYREYCYPRDGFLGRSWRKPIKTENGQAVLVLGRATEMLLDECLTADPRKRPCFVKLKRMLLGLKLIYAAIREDSIKYTFDAHCKKLLVTKKWSAQTTRFELRPGFDDNGYVQIDLIADRRGPTGPKAGQRVVIPIVYAFSRASQKSTSPLPFSHHSEICLVFNNDV